MMSKADLDLLMLLDLLLIEYDDDLQEYVM